MTAAAATPGGINPNPRTDFDQVQNWQRIAQFLAQGSAGGSSISSTGEIVPEVSISLVPPSGINVSGSPADSTGTFTMTWDNQSANTVFAGPTSDSAAAPSFRQIVAADMGLTVTGVVYKPAVGGNLGILSGGGPGSVMITNYGLGGEPSWSVVLKDSSVVTSVDWFSRTLWNASGSVTLDWGNQWLLETAGTLSLDWQNRELYFDDGTLAAQWNNAWLFDGGTVSLNWFNRALVGTDGATTIIDWATASKGDLFTFGTSGARLPVGSDGSVLTADSAQTTGLKWAPAAGIGTVGLALSNTPWFALSGSPLTASGTITITAATQSNNTFLASATGGTVTTPSFRKIMPADLGLSAAYDLLVVAGGTLTRLPLGSTGDCLSSSFGRTQWVSSLKDGSNVVAVAWGSRSLIDSSNNVVYDWDAETFYDSSGAAVMDLLSRDFCDPGGNIAISIKSGGGVKLTPSQATVSGSTSGSIVASQPLQGGAYGKVLIYVNALNGTATYTFPTAFTHAPGAGGPLSALATSISTTAVTITGSGTQTGFLWLEGF